jgi:DNA-binding NtrC family response regulator
MNAAVAELKFLVVEDERALAEAVRVHFTSQGHRVVIAYDGASALRSHRDAPADIALIDIVLENSDGMKVLRELLAGSHPPECLVVTGRGSIDGAVEAMRLGAFDYVAKPFRFEDLDARVARAAEHRARREQGIADPVALAAVERDHIANVLDHTGWHQGRAAHLLGISVRTLYRKIREYGFRRPGGDGHA